MVQCNADNNYTKMGFETATIGVDKTETDNICLYKRIGYTEKTNGFRYKVQNKKTSLKTAYRITEKPYRYEGRYSFLIPGNIWCIIYLMNNSKIMRAIFLCLVLMES